jgi:hypothetical protein
MKCSPHRRGDLGLGLPGAATLPTESGSTNESTGLFPRPAVSRSSPQGQFAVVAATFLHWLFTAKVPFGLLIPRSQVRDLPGPSRTLRIRKVFVSSGWGRTAGTHVGECRDGGEREELRLSWKTVPALRDSPSTPWLLRAISRLRLSCPGALPPPASSCLPAVLALRQLLPLRRTCRRQGTPRPLQRPARARGPRAPGRR